MLTSLVEFDQGIDHLPCMFSFSKVEGCYKRQY